MDDNNKETPKLMENILGFDYIVMGFSEELYKRRAFIGYVIEEFNFLNYMVSEILKMLGEVKLANGNKIKPKIKKLFETKVITQEIFELISEIRKIRNACSHSIKPIDKKTGEVFLRYCDEDTKEEKRFNFNIDYLNEFKKNADLCDKALFRIFAKLKRDKIFK